ncbi:hypothetical protein Pmani_037834 [Petrolisthes manimaculis]|uniref:Uncharacterized protein n=1 Tax=Petrolisthes manimaculis TaxID=1843537 RepID=A0AAE1TL18_9EUCA|nr:hypothetical protein Pmani_037834 [Petrolisthes manimaculis]
MGGSFTSSEFTTTSSDTCGQNSSLSYPPKVISSKPGRTLVLEQENVRGSISLKNFLGKFETEYGQYLASDCVNLISARRQVGLGDYRSYTTASPYPSQDPKATLLQRNQNETLRLKRVLFLTTPTPATQTLEASPYPTPPSTTPHHTPPSTSPYPTPPSTTPHHTPPSTSPYPTPPSTTPHPHLPPLPISSLHHRSCRSWAANDTFY